jgi:hypothetical protein
MSAGDLHAEMDAAGLCVLQGHLNHMRALGVSSCTIAEMGLAGWPFGIANVEPVGGGSYQPGEGFPHTILPVVEDGVLVDLVAFRSGAPDDWLLRTGHGFALGLPDGMAGYVRAEKDFWENSAHLFSNPLDWLRGGGSGICVLDWGSPEIYRLDMLAHVTVSDAATGQLLKQALCRPVRLPRIELMGVARHAA